MKRFIVLLMLLVVPVSVAADTALTAPEVRPDIDMFRIRTFIVDNTPSYPSVTIDMQLGYNDAGAFHYVDTVRVRISNLDVRRGNTTLYKADVNDEFPMFPVAYQTNPASEVISQVFAKGSAAAAVTYLEAVVKTLLGL